MAEIAEGGGGGHGKGGKKRAKKQSTKVDMTPMVDLAFLLLTFFVLTATFSKNKAMDITFPAPPEDPSKVPPTKNGVTFLLTKDDRIFYYTNQFITATTTAEENPNNDPITVLKEISYAPEGQGGVRDLLREKNKLAEEQIKKLDEERISMKMVDSVYKQKLNSINNKSDAVTVIIKADKDAKYRNVVNLIDELKLMKISKFVNVDMTPQENELLTATLATSPVK